jgi:hypothetical protein
MNEVNRNTRTLIVSFVLLIMMLIPLRFVEVGQTVNGSDKQILGETTVNQVVVTPTAILEEPYNTIENKSGCITKAEIDNAWIDLRKEVESKQVDKTTAAELISNLVLAEEKVCK